MRRHYGFSSMRTIMLAACVGGWSPLAVLAAGASQAVSAEDIQAAARTLQFLETLPRSGIVVIGIVYASDRLTADEAAREFSAQPAPNSGSFQPTLIPVEALVKFDGHVDALFLMPGVSAYAESIISTVRMRHLVSISGDPHCLDTHCCVLMVHSGERMEIVLDTSLGAAAGARFSTVFTMMVKRK
jgi:hypothetical protein